MIRPSLKFLACISVFLFSLAMTGFSQSSEQIDKLFEKLEWRNIGPANMGGRTVDIDVVESKPWIIYAAMGPSGVWKSENNGITWDPVFGADYYNVYRTIDPYSSFDTPINVFPIGTETYTDSGASSETKYFYQVRAFTN